MNKKALMRFTLFLVLPACLFGVSSGAIAAKSSNAAAQPTVKAQLAAATAEAKKWQPDAVLIAVDTSTANPDGSAYTWGYLFDSPKARDQVMIMVDDKGEVSQFPGFTAFRNPLGDFIDSDQAMAAAVAAGLKTNTFGMKMSLKSTDHAEWFIPGSDLSFTIDAVTGKLLSKE